MKILIILALSHLPLHASERLVNLRWNKNPEADVVKYEVFHGLTRLAEVPTNAAQVVLPFSECSVSVRAINAAGLVSPMSTPLVIRSVWSDVQVSVEFSKDLKIWSESFTPAARFARAKIRTPL